METSRIEYLNIEQENKILESLKQRLIKSCIDFNPKASNFVFESEIQGNYIFCLLTCETKSEMMPLMYRMLTVYSYAPKTDLYFNGNVLGTNPYTIDDVKQKTINSLQYNLKKIKESTNL